MLKECLMDEYIRHLSELEPVTICIAAICDVGYEKLYPKIILCADRFVSSLVQQEGAMVKIKKLATHCLVMASSNDTETSDMLLERVRVKLQADADTSGKKYVISEIVDIVRQECIKYKEERISNEVLGKYNLIARKVGVDPKALVTDALEELDVYHYGLKCEFIIAGFDAPTEPHIYTVNQDGGYRSNDVLGYSQIGSGSLLAYFQMTKSGHSINDPSVNTIPIVYFAKKLSERAQGVGRITDLYAMFYSYHEKPPPNHVCSIMNLATQELIEQMDKSLEDIQRYETERLDAMGKEVHEVLTGKAKAAPAPKEGDITTNP
jgi:20S proteasome alpha/beta subunit